MYLLQAFCPFYCFYCSSQPAVVLYKALGGGILALNLSIVKELGYQSAFCSVIIKNQNHISSRDGLCRGWLMLVLRL